ncbi:MAG: bifunctional ornithine acetyltransferase/N-acetylglutamate synthase [Lentisphaerae bacterium GWF2_52_8]|nr:MAG: bifunctional ornithine acetyltransferase/N-acetylglutamate synthase [Lentisphaerae bacterium GWF2_52_8]
MKTNTFTLITEGTVSSPAGFLASGVCAGLKRSGANDMALIFSKRPANFAGSFTSCLFAAAPVVLDRERVLSQPFAQAIIVNSGNANACTGEEGYKRAVKMAALTAEALNIPEEQVLVSSTGRIGVDLPMDKISKGVSLAASALSENGGHAAACAIMTTDTRPKELAVEFKSVSGKTVRVGGMVKGAGMIAPQMTVPHATMLAYITSDAGASNAFLAKELNAALPLSFNRITVDGDMSTNDTVLVLANGSSGVDVEADPRDAERFAESFQFVMSSLARQIVEDGEGMTKFVNVEINGAATEEDARLCANAIANSLLCKTAWFGGDPNWGRVLAAAGRSGAKFDPSKVSLDYDSTPVVRNGRDVGTPEASLAEVMKKKEFSVSLNLGAGEASFTVWTNDVSYEYVKINADYHT